LKDLSAKVLKIAGIFQGLNDISASFDAGAFRPDEDKRFKKNKAMVSTRFFYRIHINLYDLD
jgi:hypothetical protein